MWRCRLQVDWAKVSYYLDPAGASQHGVLPAVHSIVDVVRVLHQSACKLPKAEISILNQIYSHFYSLPVKLSDKSFSHFNFSLPTVYVLTLWFQIRGLVVGVVRCTKYSQPVGTTFLARLLRRKERRGEERRGCEGIMRQLWDVTRGAQQVVRQINRW